MSSEQTAPQAAISRQVVVFEIGHEEYAAPIEQVREVLKTPNITLVPNGQAFVVGVMNLRGQIVPVIDLEKLFSLPETGETAAQHIVVSEDSTHTLFGVQVDHVLEVLRVPANTIKPTPKMVTARISTDYLDGVIVLEGDDKTSKPDKAGRMILLLNLQKIMSDKALNQLKAEGIVAAK
jgi:purine-binding chemotaxis protein CheW